MMNLSLWRWLTIVGMLGLIVVIILWNGMFTTVQYMNPALEMSILIAPLLFFIRGIFHADRDKHVAISLLSFVYFCLGIWFIFAPHEEIYGYLITVLSLCLYLGGFFYARTLDKLEAIAISKSEEVAD